MVPIKKGSIAGQTRHCVGGVDNGASPFFTVALAILLSLLLVSTTVSSQNDAADTEGSEQESSSAMNNEWRQFGQDPGHTGYTEAVIPLGNVSTIITTLNDPNEHLGPILTINNTVFIETYQILPQLNYPPSILRRIYSINPYTGLVNWVWENYTRGRGEVNEAYPAITDKSIILTSYSRIIALNLTTGETNWVQSYDSPFNKTDDYLWFNWRNPIAVSGEVGVTGFTNRSVTVVTAFDVNNGKPIWNYTLNRTIEIPALDELSVIIADKHGNVLSLDLATGQELWKTKLTAENLLPLGVSTPRIMDDSIYLVMPGEIYSLNKKTGTLIWNTTTNETVYSVAVNEDSVYLGLERGILQLNITDGSIDRYIQIYKFPHYELSIGGNGLVANTKEGIVYAINLTDQSELWSLNISGPKSKPSSTNPTVIVDGAIFLTRYDSENSYSDKHYRSHRDIVLIIPNTDDNFQPTQYEDSSTLTLNGLSLLLVIMVIMVLSHTHNKKQNEK